MRRYLPPALCLLAAVALCSFPVAGGRVSSSSPARLTPPVQKRKTRASNARPPVVREVNLEGLMKLLQRDGKPARPLLVNFWATWCDPCREEFPDLVQIDRDYRARGLEFIIVSIDDASEIRTTVPQYLKKMRALMPAYLLNVPDPEPAIKTVDEEWGGGLPATFLYDASGRVVFKQMGRVNALELRAAIEKVAGLQVTMKK
jgi:thiol-disulfide isomerase/thioredoxin